MPPKTSTRFLLDTNILVYYARGDAMALHIEMTYQLQNSPIVPLISVVTIGEMYSMALRNKWNDDKKKALQKIIDVCYPVPLEFAGLFEAYAEIDVFAQKTGVAFSRNDVWIAATARATRTTLLTCDKDFDPLVPLFFQSDFIDPRSV